MSAVIVHVRDGLVQHVQVPWGVFVDVLDYDTEGGHPSADICECADGNGESHGHSQWEHSA